MLRRRPFTRRALVAACVATVVAAEETHRAYAAPKLVEIGRAASPYLGHSGASTGNRPPTGGDPGGGGQLPEGSTGGGQLPGGEVPGGGQLPGGSTGGGPTGATGSESTGPTFGSTGTADPGKPSLAGEVPMVVSALPATGTGSAAHD
jgi:hypothetical protein